MYFFHSMRCVTSPLRTDGSRRVSMSTLYSSLSTRQRSPLASNATQTGNSLTLPLKTSLLTKKLHISVWTRSLTPWPESKGRGAAELSCPACGVDVPVALS